MERYLRSNTLTHQIRLSTPTSSVNQLRHPPPCIFVRRDPDCIEVGNFTCIHRPVQPSDSQWLLTNLKVSTPVNCHGYRETAVDFANCELDEEAQDLVGKLVLNIRKKYRTNIKIKRRNPDAERRYERVETVTLGEEPIREGYDEEVVQNSQRMEYTRYLRDYTSVRRVDDSLIDLSSTSQSSANSTPTNYTDAPLLPSAPAATAVTTTTEEESYISGLADELENSYRNIQSPLHLFPGTTINLSPIKPGEQNTRYPPRSSDIGFGKARHRISELSLPIPVRVEAVDEEVPPPPPPALPPVGHPIDPDREFIGGFRFKPFCTLCKNHGHTAMTCPC